MSQNPFLFSPLTPGIVGVLNVTPDSFSDGGKFLSSEAAIDRAHAMKECGANIIEVGGESTAPNATPVRVEVEIERTLPVIQSLASHMCIAVDTFRSNTARICLEHGARIINDVSALRYDNEMLPVIRDFTAGLVIMHSKEQGNAPHVTESQKEYKDVVLEISEFLLRQVDRALHAGIRQDFIAVDPGMGRFVSHDSRYSWQLLREFDRLVDLVKPFPVMIGTSRKGFLGGALTERDAVSQFTAISAVEKGARLIRTHNVFMARQFLDIWRNLAAPLLNEPNF